MNEQSNRQQAFNLVNDHNVDREALCNYLLNDWLSGAQAHEAVKDFVHCEMGINLDEPEDEEDEDMLGCMQPGEEI